MSTELESMEEPSQFNATDRRILDILHSGRETRGSLADQVEKHENYVGERLKWLRSFGYVEYHHEETALYQLTQKGEKMRQRLRDYYGGE